mgnify:CR=1 FL=1|jgi:hypothetical protein
MCRIITCPPDAITVLLVAGVIDVINIEFGNA